MEKHNKIAFLLIEAVIGPRARARAPIERNTPRINPFWLDSPTVEISVDKDGTKVAEEKEYSTRPAMNGGILYDRAITMNAGMTATILCNKSN